MSSTASVSNDHSVTNELTDREKKQASASWRSPFNPDWDDKMSVQTPAGFQNAGDECYRNVTFQMLLHAPVFLHWVDWYRRHHIPRGETCRLGEDEQECKVCLFHGFCTIYWGSDRTDYKTRFDDFWDLVFNDWAGGTNEGQQDPAEFFPELYRQFHEDVRELFRLDLEHICRLPVIHVRTCKGKHACRDKTFTTDESAFLHATFSGDDTETMTIEEAVGRFFDEEVIADGKCSKCKNNRATTDRIGHPPELLLVHLNRIDEKALKISRPIQFSETLTLKSECFDPRLAGMRESVEYELSSVQMHRGDTTQSGHYVIAVKGPTGNWTLIDDDETEDYAEFTNFASTDSVQQEAYIFAYRRLPTKPDDVEMIAGEENDTEIENLAGSDSATKGAATSSGGGGDRGRLELRFTSKEGTETFNIEISGQLRSGIYSAQQDNSGEKFPGMTEKQDRGRLELRVISKEGVETLNVEIAGLLKNNLRAEQSSSKKSKGVKKRLSAKPPVRRRSSRKKKT
ncbi:uncharacterized protein N7459_003919 [Penicillium hispanicum]|uniref:uncharacterized protein n=1 Tax=Penicillium hispanicum TaxID=1080232 RepID=UPI0025425372|nr:uncharacterized protein N7459_003919 [Penicillium hispanicum]KAJ5584119.1 hypothetical protein N7459_003919 [Penicillium hispanicum]